MFGELEMKCFLMSVRVGMSELGYKVPALAASTTRSYSQ